MSSTSLSRAFFAAGLVIASSSASAVNVDGTGRTIILNPVAFINVEDLDFGAVLAPSSGVGTMWINPTDNSMSYGGGLTPLLSGNPHRGYMIGSAEPGDDILVTATLPTKLHRNGDVTQPFIPISVQLDHIGSSAGEYFYVGKKSHTFTVYVGGTLSVPAGTLSGNYSNLFTLTAEHL